MFYHTLAPAPDLFAGCTAELPEEIEETLEQIAQELQSTGPMNYHCLHERHELCSGFVIPHELSDASELTVCQCSCHRHGYT